VLEGGCRLAVDGHRPLTAKVGDFVLLPATPGFTMSGFEPARLERLDSKVMSKVAGEVRLSTLVRMVGEEASESRPGRDLVLTRLVEVLLIEALRATPSEDAPPGLLRGLGDERLAPAIRQVHWQLARSWTVPLLARTAALSRSAFFERFTRTVGLPPMEYLPAWRMAVAKDLLRRRDFSVAEEPERVGYGSASTFSTAFSRHVGQSPSRYAAGVRASAQTTVVRT
jgi:AraC-like DNA-binding protein